MTTAEMQEPTSVPELPGSINSILEEHPSMSVEDAANFQGQQIERYRVAASMVLGVAVEELHDMPPTAIRQGLENRSIGEAA